MGVVELAIVDPNTLTERHRVLAELLAGLGVEKFNPEQLMSDAFGKPYLELDKRQIGYSFSNARHEDGSFGLMALVDGFAVGVDIELWPRRSNDKDFLKSIASPEDEGVLCVLSAGGYDAGIALWVIKEAALKCLGEVMVDPRHLAVSQYRDGLFIVGPSALAGAAHLEVSVKLFELRAEKWPELVFLCGAAMHKQFSTALKDFKVSRFHCVGWQLSSL